MTPYQSPREDHPTRAELDAAEHAAAEGRSITDGMVACRYGCTQRFWAHATDAALRHYAEVHGRVAA